MDKQELAGSSLKAAPGLLALAADRVMKLTLNDWVLILTIAYLSLQILHLLWRWYFQISQKKEAGDE